MQLLFNPFDNLNKAKQSLSECLSGKIFSDDFWIRKTFDQPQRYSLCLFAVSTVCYILALFERPSLFKCNSFLFTFFEKWLFISDFCSFTVKHRFWSFSSRTWVFDLSSGATLCLVALSGKERSSGQVMPLPTDQVKPLGSPLFQQQQFEQKKFDDIPSDLIHKVCP